MARIDSNGLHKHFRVSDDWWNITEDDKGNPPSRGLFIGNIPNGTKGSSIRDIFAAYGKIETSSPAGFGQVDRGFALLTYRDIDSAQRAISRCYGQDLFDHGEGCTIRFSNSQQQSKMPAPGRSSFKIVEARSEWFQQSKYSPAAVARARKIENEDVLSRAEPTPQLPPTAPKKMLEFARKLLTSPSAPRTTRVDISPPPLRRIDTYRPDPVPLREEKRRSSYDQRPNDIDRYVPSYRVRDELHSSRRDDESHSPPRCGRSPGWSSSYSQAFEARFSSSEDRRSLSIQASTQNRPSAVAQPYDLLDRSEENVKPGASQLPTVSANTAVSSLGHAAAAKRDQREGTAPQPDLAKGVARSLHELQVSALEDFSKPVVAPLMTDSQVVNLPSLPSVTKAQEDLAASATTSLTWHRLRPPTDETSSITSSSTKSSQRKRQCAHCEAPDGLLLGTLTKCKDCNRRYHSSCGKPTPGSMKEHETFTCGRCVKKSRTSMPEQTRAASPELGTPNDDSAMLETPTDEPVKALENVDEAVRPSNTNADMLAKKRPGSRLDDSKAGSSTHSQGLSRFPVGTVTDVPTKSPTVTQIRSLKLEDTTRICQEGTKSVQRNSHKPADTDQSPVNTTQTAVRGTSYQGPYVTTEAEALDSSAVGDFLPVALVTSPKVPDTTGNPLTSLYEPADEQLRQENTDELGSARVPQPEKNRPTLDKSHLEDSHAISMALTRAQEQAAEMAKRYKKVTCDLWKLSHCRFEFCMFAHRDTGIYVPDRRSYNPLWTCYAWMRGSVCPHGDRCRFAHQDTGLYAGFDGRCSKKHVTCSYWHNGRCKHAAESCLFAHEDTGISADGRVSKHVMKAISAASHHRPNSSIVNSSPLVNTSPRGSYHTLRAALTPSLNSRVPAPMVSVPDRCSTTMQQSLGDSRTSALDERPTVEQDAAQMQSANPGLSINLTYDQALRFLGAEDDFVGDHQLTALFRAKTRDDKRLEPQALQAMRLIAKHRKSALLQNWMDPGSAKSQAIVNNASTLESSPYSPRSTIEDSKPPHRLETPSSPTSSIARSDQNLVYGIDTSYSPTFTMATTEQSSPQGENIETNSKAAPVSNAIHSESSPRLSSPFSPVSAITALNAGSGLSSVTETLVAPQPTREQNEASKSVASTTNPTPEPRHDQIDKPLSNGVSDPTLQGTDGNSRSNTDIELQPAVGAVPAKAVTSKHYAKRSTVDPRALRRNMLATAAAKSASPAEGSVSSITSIKKCEKCDKRIFASASFCTSCSKAPTSARTSCEGSPERSKSHDPGDQGVLRTSGESSNKIHLGIANFMEANATRSVLAAAQKHAVSLVSDPISAKSLKRPHENAVFIQRKRPKVMLPLKKPSFTRRKGLASETSQIQHVSIVNSKLKFSEPPSIDQAVRDNCRDRVIVTEPTPGAASGDTGRQRQNVETPDQPSNNKENRRPSFSFMSQTTEEPNAKASEEEDGSEVITTIRPNYNTSHSKESVSVTRTQPEIVAENEDEDDDDVVSELSSSTNDPLPERRIMLKLKVSKTTPATICCTCRKHHKSCLHDEAGHMDPARCADYLERVKNGSRKHDKYWSSRLPGITAAAKRYTDGGYEGESEANDDSDGLEIRQDAADSMVPASPSSAENPLGHIDSSTTQGLRQRSGKLDGAHSNSSSTEKTKAKTQEVHAAIPTPAHTPSPALGAPEIQISPQTPSRLPGQDASKPPKPNLKKVLGMLRKRSVQFDSDDDSDEDMEDTRPSATAQPFSWPPKASSLDLFEVAPALRPPAEPSTTVHKPAPTTPNLRAGLSKKELWKNLQSIQCAERRAKYGNPHKVVDRKLPGQMVKTTIQEEALLTEAQRLAFHVPTVEIKKVEVPFGKFLGMPDEPVVVRENTFRNREGKMVEFDLAFRDGRKSLGFTVGGRMVGDGKVRWPFARI